MDWNNKFILSILYARKLNSQCWHDQALSKSSRKESFLPFQLLVVTSNSWYSFACGVITPHLCLRLHMAVCPLVCSCVQLSVFISVLFKFYFQLKHSKSTIIVIPIYGNKVLFWYMYTQCYDYIRAISMSIPSNVYHFFVSETFKILCSLKIMLLNLNVFVQSWKFLLLRIFSFIPLYPEKMSDIIILTLKSCLSLFHGLIYDLFWRKFHLLKRRMCILWMLDKMIYKCC